jgi:hypothetical protein
MDWILVVFLSGIGMQVAPALTSIAVDTEAACQAAGAKIVQDLATKYHVVKFSCTRKN